MSFNMLRTNCSSDHNTQICIHASAESIPDRFHHIGDFCDAGPIQLWEHGGSRRLQRSLLAHKQYMGIPWHRTIPLQINVRASRHPTDGVGRRGDGVTLTKSYTVRPSARSRPEQASATSGHTRQDEERAHGLNPLLHRQASPLVSLSLQVKQNKWMTHGLPRRVVRNKDKTSKESLRPEFTGSNEKAIEPSPLQYTPAQGA